LSCGSKLNLIRSILKNNLTVANYIYNERGQIASVYFTNGSYASFDYNGANQPVELTNYNVNGIVMERFKYTHSTNGNIISIQTTKGTINYQYDQLNQLTQETLLDGSTIYYEYDSVGNRTKKTVSKEASSTVTYYTYNQANQLIAENSQAMQYNLNGNMVDNGENLFVYNSDNQLFEVKVKTTGNTLASFTYDYQGRRKTMTTSSGITTFHYDQRDNVIFETDQSGTIQVEYTWDNDNRPITMAKNGITYYYHLNVHGDVIALTDKDGNIVASYYYDAWGNVLSQFGSIASLNPYRYAGYRYDENLKLYYLMARYYNPNTGVFLTIDPATGDLLNPITKNGYNYANNNPIMMVDINGEKPKPYFTKARIKFALKYALEAWVASYIGWTDARSVISGIASITDKLRNVISAGISEGKSAKVAMSKGLNEVLGRQNKKINEKIIKNAVKKLSAKAAARVLTKFAFWYADIVILAGNFGWGIYIYKG
jgi:RHS repeat-associated protein